MGGQVQRWWGRARGGWEGSGPGAVPDFCGAQQWVLSWWGAPGRVPAHPLCGATKEQLMFTKHLLSGTVAETDNFICPACITCSQSANCRTLSLSHGDWSSRNG